MPADRRALLLSVRPRYADLLLDGSKSVELRRVRPSVKPGALVLIYASSPARALVGSGRVHAIEAGGPAEIWCRHGSRTGVTPDEYDVYFEGATAAVAISLTGVQPLSRPTPLAELRARTGFRPPQSFRYLAAADTLRLGFPFGLETAGA